MIQHILHDWTLFQASYQLLGMLMGMLHALWEMFRGCGTFFLEDQTSM